MKKKAIFIFLLSLSIVSCQRNRQMQTLALDAVSPISLYADSLNLSEKFLAPRKVFVLDGGIAVFEPQDANGFLHFYDGAGNRTGTYGTIGGAKHEYISPNVFANGESVIVLSSNGRFSEIRQTDAGYASVNVREIGNKELAAGAGFLATDSHGGIVVNSASSDDMLVFVDSLGCESGYNGYPVDVMEKMDAFVMNNIISSCTYSISNRLDTLFQVFKYYPVAGVISLNDKQSVRKALAVENDNEYIMKDGIPHYEDPVLFYTYAASSEKYFYALFQNGTKSSIKEGGVSEIHVFTRNGSLKGRYILDRRIYHFAVTPDDSIIYALGVNEALLSELYFYRL